MDPIGFALDNFDAVGRWRTVDESGTPIDPSGVFPDGTKFEGVAGLRQLLLSHPEQFVTHADRKPAHLFVGPKPRVLRCAGGSRDRARRAAPGDYRFSSLVMGIVKSTPFQMRSRADN